MRIVGTGYHGTDEPRGGFYLSGDRGHTWRGPYRFHGLIDREPLLGLEMTPRTDYMVNDAGDCLVFLSARNPDVWGSDRVFCAKTTDGGQTFAFISWIVPPSDPYRRPPPDPDPAAPPAEAEPPETEPPPVRIPSPLDRLRDILPDRPSDMLPGRPSDDPPGRPRDKSAGPIDGLSR